MAEEAQAGGSRTLNLVLGVAAGAGAAYVVWKLFQGRGILPGGQPTTGGQVGIPPAPAPQPQPSPTPQPSPSPQPVPTPQPQPVQRPGAPSAPWEISHRDLTLAVEEMTIGWQPAAGAQYYRVRHAVDNQILAGPTSATSAAIRLHRTPPGQSPWPLTIYVEACNSAGCTAGPAKTFYGDPEPSSVQVALANCPVLQQGSTGSLALQLQTALALLGYADPNTFALDGIYGPDTAAAVRRLQQANGIYVDGVAGCQTFGVLDTLLRNRGLGYWSCSNCQGGGGGGRPLPFPY